MALLLARHAAFSHLKLVVLHTTVNIVDEPHLLGWDDRLAQLRIDYQIEIVQSALRTPSILADMITDVYAN